MPAGFQWWNGETKQVALTVGLTSAALVLALGWLGRSRKQRPQWVSGTLILRYPKSVMIVGLADAVLFGGIAAGLWLSPQRPDEGPTLLGLLSLCLLGVGIVLDCCRTRLDVSEAGVVSRTILGRLQTSLWMDVRLVRYERALKWFRVELRNETSFRVSAMLVGLPQFAQLLLASTPSAEIDDETRGILRDGASGLLPRWIT